MVFIVVALGSRDSLIVPAAIGAAAALGSVVLLGLAIHRPLSRVPENTLKFSVAILLSAFGTFWVGEGIGVAWPAEHWALLALILTYLATGRLLVLVSKVLPRGHGHNALDTPEFETQRGYPYDPRVGVHFRR